MNLDLGDTRLIISEARRQGLLRNQLAYVLATAYWETARTMKPVKEAYWLSEDWRKKNLRYYPWYGRGYIQITWEENYKKYGISNPDDALKPDVAARVIIDGMKHGKFRGKRLADYITLSRSDYKGARDIVNGDQGKVVDGERIDEKIAGFAREYDALLKAEGYGTDPAPAPPPGTPAGKSSPGAGGIVALIVAAILALVAFVTDFFGLGG